MGAVTSTPLGEFYVVPLAKRSSVNTSDLIIAQLVRLGHALETIQSQKIEVPLCSILLKLANLKPRVSPTRLQAGYGVESPFLQMFFLFLNRGTIGDASEETNAHKKER